MDNILQFPSSTLLRTLVPKMAFYRHLEVIVSAKWYHFSAVSGTTRSGLSGTKKMGLPIH
ncbi:MAG: hypothetical protein ACRCZY_08770 [Phocaeicola sp.]